MRAANTRITKPGRCDEDIRKSHSYPKELRGEYSAALIGRMEAGVIFEDELIDKIRELYPDDDSVVILEGGQDRKKWKEETLEALNDPKVRFLVNPSLPTAKVANLTGDPDFLIRTDEGYWVPVDAKNHREYVGTSKKVIHYTSPLEDVWFENKQVVQNAVGTPHQDDSVQLAHYHVMLNELGFGGGADREAWGGIIGRSGDITWRRLDIPLSSTAKKTPLQIHAETYAHREAIIDQEDKRLSGDRQALPLVSPAKNSLCGDCPWKKVCFAEMEAEDHPTLLPGVTAAAWEKLKQAGVTSRFKLAKLDHHTAKVMGAGVDIAALREILVEEDNDDRLLISVAAVKDADRKALKAVGVETVGDIKNLDESTLAVGGPKNVKWLARAIDQARAQQDGRVYLERDVNFVGFRRAGIEIDIDIEDSEGYVYLFGALVSGRKSRGGEKKTRSEYHAFTSWDETAAGEAKAFADFWKLLTDTIEYARANKYGVKIYHYSSHEISAFKRLAKLHAGQPGVPTEAEVDAMVKWDGWIDLFPVLKSQMIWPTAGYSVKDLAKYARHSWTGDGASGALSLIQYANAVSHEDPDEREIAQEELLVYNREDNEATLRIRDWISELSVTEQRPGEKLDSIESRDGFWNALRKVQ